MSLSPKNQLMKRKIRVMFLQNYMTLETNLFCSKTIWCWWKNLIFLQNDMTKVNTTFGRRTPLLIIPLVCFWRRTPQFWTNKIMPIVGRIKMMGCLLFILFVNVVALLWWYKDITTELQRQITVLYCLRLHDGLQNMQNYTFC